MAERHSNRGHEGIGESLGGKADELGQRIRSFYHRAKERLQKLRSRASRMIQAHEADEGREHMRHETYSRRGPQAGWSEGAGGREAGPGTASFYERARRRRESLHELRPLRPLRRRELARRERAAEYEARMHEEARSGRNGHPYEQQQ